MRRRRSVFDRHGLDHSEWSDNWSRLDHRGWHANSGAHRGGTGIVVDGISGQVPAETGREGSGIDHALRAELSGIYGRLSEADAVILSEGNRFASRVGFRSRRMP